MVLAKNGERVWTCSRHPLNQRGDMASVASRKASVETVGIIQGLRGGAWLLPRDDVLQDPAWGSFIQHYHVLHWATLIEGAKLAWEEDTTKTNAVVQLSVTSGLTGCKIFMKKTPAYIIKYLVDLGNSMNSENSATTFLDVIRSIEGVEAAWAKKKDAMQWTIASEGQSTLEHRKLTFANGLHKGRWRSYRSLEMTVNIWNQSRSKEKMIDATTTFWDAFVDFCQRDVDFTSELINRHADIIANVYFTLKHLRGKHIAYAMMVLRLVLPLREQATKIAVCPFLPAGLDTSSLRVLQDKGRGSRLPIMLRLPFAP